MTLQSNNYDTAKTLASTRVFSLARTSERSWNRYSKL